MPPEGDGGFEAGCWPEGMCGGGAVNHSANTAQNHACAFLSAEYLADWQSLTLASKQPTCFLVRHTQSRMSVLAALKVLPEECSFGI